MAQSGKKRHRNTVRRAARRCSSLAYKRFREALRAVTDAYRAAGWEVQCISKPVERNDGIYWPAREIAILVEVTDVETQWTRYVEDSLRIAKLHIGDDWPYRVAAVINGHVVAAL